MHRFRYDLAPGHVRAQQALLAVHPMTVYRALREDFVFVLRV